jgi:UrcA family protein
MSKTIATLSSIATLALAVLPALAIVSGAHAESVSVKVSDLNLATVAGQKAFDQRVNVAARQYCAGSITTGTRLSSLAACRTAVRAEIVSKLAKPQETASNQH